VYSKNWYCESEGERGVRGGGEGGGGGGWGGGGGSPGKGVTDTKKKVLSMEGK